MRNSFPQTKPGSLSRFQDGHSALQFLALAAISVMAAAMTHAAAPASPQGVITGKGFLDTGAGTAVTDLTGNAKFPNSPDVVFYYPYFEWNADASGDIGTPANNAYGNNYGAQMIGYFYPPVTGDYIFYLSADDGSNLYLSTDDAAANKKLIAQEAGWSNPRNWDQIGGGSTIAAKNSQTFTGTQWATKDPAGGAKITLTANKPYYIEALVKEGGGGDNLAVAVAAPDGSIDQSLPIPGKYLSSDKSSGPLTIVTQPASKTVPEGQPATFNVVVDGTPPYTYQWKRNGADIAGATTSSYTISRVASTDNGVKFTVALTGAQGNLTSTEATLTVSSDVTPPTIEKVRTTDTFNVARITFTEPVNNAAVTPSNYTFSGGLTVSDANFAIVVDDPNTPENPKNPTNPVNRVTVVLNTSTQTDGASYDLTVNANVKDLVGNAISPNTAKMYANTFKSGIVLHKRWYGLGHRNFATLLEDTASYEAPTATFVRTLVEEDDADLDSQEYMTTLSGFFTPATTGDYTFYISVDNFGWLYLSTDDNPRNQVMVAAEIGWNGTRVWTGPGAFTTEGNAATETAAVYRRGVANPADPYAPWVGPFENRSDQFLTSDRFLTQNLEANRPFTDITPWPTVDATGNAKITLTAGKRYSFTLYHSEPESGQSCATFKVGSEADPANGTASRMTGPLIGTLIDPSSLPPIITNQPVNVDFTLGGTINLSVGVDSAAPPKYQWYRGNTAVPGATSSTLTISNATAADAGAYYVAVNTVNGSVNSANVLVYTPAPAPPRRTFQQDGTGLVVIEAENYYDSIRAKDGHVFYPQTDRAGYVGTGYLQAFPDSGVNNGAYPDFLTLSPRLDYKVNFTKSGTHYVWLRGGSRTSDGAGDSVHAGIDGDNPASARRVDGTPSFNIATGWNWVGNIQGDTRATITVPSAGEHTFNIWMREDGFVLDRVLLTTDEAFTPTGDGPAQSSSTGGGVTPTISLARNATGAPVITFTGTLQQAASIGNSITWTDVGGAVSPYTAPITATQAYYRAKQ